MKVIKNNGYGAYGISVCAIAEFLRAQGYNDLHFYAKRFSEENKDKNFLVEMDEDVAYDHFRYEPVFVTTEPIDKAPSVELYSENSFDSKEYRTNPYLINAVEQLKRKANGYFAELEIVEIPDGINFEILNFDGKEYIVEEGHIW